MSDEQQTIQEERRGHPVAGIFTDRRHVSLPVVVGLVTLILQLGAIIWGAATFKAAVTSLEIVAKEMQSDIRTVQGDVNGLKVDVGILKARADK